MCEALAHVLLARQTLWAGGRESQSGDVREGRGGYVRDAGARPARPSDAVGRVEGESVRRCERGREADVCETLPHVLLARQTLWRGDGREESDGAEVVCRNSRQ